MTRNAASLAWNVTSLVCVAVVIGLAIGHECVLPPAQAEAAAPGLARSLDIPEASARRELQALLSGHLAWRIVVQSVLFSPLVALLMVRLVRERRGTNVAEETNGANAHTSD